MKKYCFIAIFALLGVISVVITPKATLPSSLPEATRSTGVPPAMETIQRQAGGTPSHSGNPPTSRVHALSNPTLSEASRLAPLLSAPISLRDGGSERAFELARDQLYLRGIDGASRILVIPQSVTPEAFASEIEKARTEHGTEPELVLYPIGLPRNEYTRRIVTRDVIVNASSRLEADALASAQGLVFRKAPAFAPDAFVYEAPTSVAALSALTVRSSPVKAAPLLASLASRKSMPNDPFVQLQWHLKYQNHQGAVAGTDINVESVWNYPSVSAGNYTRGGNVTIGIVDDGLEWSHPDLARNMRNDLNWDWNGKDNDPKPSPGDDHGTACAGVAAARGNNRIGVSGVAPEASLVGMRINLVGGKTDLDEAEAMTWWLSAEKYTDINENGRWDQLEPFNDKNSNGIWDDAIHIKSNSWGPSDDGYTLKAPDSLMAAALKYAADFGRDGKGSIITFAGGNGRANDDNSNYDGYANSIYTIAVAAMDSDGLQSSYSESGANLIVSAPSNGGPLGIMTTDNKGPAGYNYGVHNTLFTWPPVDDFKGSGDVTQNFGGTSSACPTVSGVIALMLDKNSDLGWRDVQEILIKSAKKVDLDDTDWIDNGAGFHFNHKYGSGLVDAAAAVALSGNWTNLSQQKSQTVTTNATTPIDATGNANATITFTVNGSNLRTEHATLALTVTGIPKGDLTITLTSPGNTTSTFCEPHSDTTNTFTSWKFMTVRNWGESSNGTWTLTITNNGTTTGNLTYAELVVYGTELGADTNPAPVVTVEASRTHVFVGSNFTLNSSAKDKNADATLGTIETLEAYVDGASLGLSENGTWTIQANKSGNYTFTVNATDSQSATATSKAITIQVQDAPIAAWDFDTTSQSPIPLATAVQSVRKYAANFGSGNMTFNGSFDGNATNSNNWEYGQGQIFTADGTAVNAVANMESGTSNKALLLRGGKNIGAEGKSIVFEFSMAGQENLNVSYAGAELSGGFTRHAWSWSIDATTWTPLQTITPTSGFTTTCTLNQTAVLNNSTTAYLRLQVSGSTAVSGQNLIDNIIFSTSPITAGLEGALEREALKTFLEMTVKGSLTTGTAPSGLAVSQPATSQKAPEQNLDWVALEGGAYSMVVHAEVVDGAKFLNAPGNLLSANEDGKVLGLAEPILQATSYKLEISSTDSAPQPLRLKVYDSKSKGILVLEEKVPFAPSSTIGTPSIPKRYKVAYQEAEQLVLLAPGWNTFTTAVDPDPATFGGVFSGYDYSEGDQLLGPNFKATVVGGKWSPSGLKFVPRATYSLLRQAPTASQIILKGKEVNNSNPKPGPGQPVPQQKKTEISPASTNPSGSQGGAPAKPHASSEKSSPKSKSSKKSKPSQKSKSLKSNKKNSGKKKPL